MLQKDTFCSFCASRFPAELPWPRRCPSCLSISYKNPIPVCVVLLPVEGKGLVVIRRGIEPKRGALALPGGFVDHGESWQDAGAREVFEEAGIALQPSSLTLLTAFSALPANLLLFALAPEIRVRDLPPFLPNEEVTERLILWKEAELAFPFHTKVAAIFFRTPKV